jgi:hypothetical protein
MNILDYSPQEICKSIIIIEFKEEKNIDKSIDIIESAMELGLSEKFINKLINEMAVLLLVNCICKN